MQAPRWPAPHTALRCPRQAHQGASNHTSELQVAPRRPPAPRRLLDVSHGRLGCVRLSLCRAVTTLGWWHRPESSPVCGQPDPAAGQAPQCPAVSRDCRTHRSTGSGRRQTLAPGRGHPLLSRSLVTCGCHSSEFKSVFQRWAFFCRKRVLTPSVPSPVWPGARSGLWEHLGPPER